MVDEGLVALLLCDPVGGGFTFFLTLAGVASGGLTRTIIKLITLNNTRLNPQTLTCLNLSSRLPEESGLLRGLLR